MLSQGGLALANEQNGHQEVGEDEDAEKDEGSDCCDLLRAQVISRVCKGKRHHTEYEVDKLHEKDVNVHFTRHVRLLFRQVEHKDGRKHDDDRELGVGWGHACGTQDYHQRSHESSEEKEAWKEDAPSILLIYLQEQCVEVALLLLVLQLVELRAEVAEYTQRDEESKYQDENCQDALE